MPRLCVTGADGFLGWHLRAHLLAVPGFEVVACGRSTVASPDALAAAVAGCDAVAHLAGVNRGTDAEVEQGNVTLAERLVAALERGGSAAHVVYANSTHRERDTPYGRSKRRAAGLLAGWAARAGGRFTDLVLPHVFGEGGRPRYNSAVATFCHQLAAGESPRIVNDSELELVHAQDVAAAIAVAVLEGGPAERRLAGPRILVSAVLAKLEAMARQYAGGLIPRFDSPLDLDLFNAYRACLFPGRYPVALELKSDARGSLFEAVKTGNGGQCFLSTTRPGVTRGNHYHRRKVERFLVVQGEALIRVRRLLTREAAEFRVSGARPAFIDMPTLHTHDITNTGPGELLTLFWSHEIFDPSAPDTYTEKV